MNVTVDKDLCIGCGLCESSCPDIFEMKENIAVVKNEPDSPDQEVCAKSMVQDCPVNAIKMEE